MKKNSLLKSLAFLFVPLFMAACGKDKEDDIKIKGDEQRASILGKWKQVYFVEKQYEGAGVDIKEHISGKNENIIWNFSENKTFANTFYENGKDTTVYGNYYTKVDSIYLHLIGDEKPLKTSFKLKTNPDTLLIKFEGGSPMQGGLPDSWWSIEGVLIRR